MGPLNIGATTTTQTDPREIRASCCWRGITPRDVTTPAATSEAHKIRAKRACSCLVNCGALSVVSTLGPALVLTPLGPPLVASVRSTAGNADVGNVSRSHVPAPADDAVGAASAVAMPRTDTSTGAANDVASTGPLLDGSDRDGA